MWLCVTNLPSDWILGERLGSEAGWGTALARGHFGTTAKTADLWIAACKLNDLQWTWALVGAKWRYQALLYLKLITISPFPGDQAQPHTEAVFCQGGGADYNVLLDKSFLPPLLAHCFPVACYTRPSPTFPSLRSALLFCLHPWFHAPKPTAPPPQAIHMLICHCASDWNTSETGESRRVGDECLLA